MSEPQTLGLDFLADDTLSGYRLQSLEVLNWGTFNRRVWNLQLDGKNGLLTGDIGSGKSTLVDAITTLLVPAQRITYNKAAGAENKERNLRSYVLGHYKAERHEMTGAAKSIPLRQVTDYSVILAVFYNAGYDKKVTLAQVFWFKDTQGQPARFFVGAEKALSISKDFSQFGSDMSQLKKKLKLLGAEIEDTFPKYSAWFKRRLGIENEQALELFHQTVSMKSVGNLTDFVRSHMLEPSAMSERIGALINHFDDLNRAHEAVLKAKRQVELLLPLVADCQRHRTLLVEVDELRQCREALRSYFARLKLELLDKRLKNLHEDSQRLSKQQQGLDEQQQEQNKQRDALQQAISNNGGDRLASLAAEITHKERERERRRAKAQRYAELVNNLHEEPATDEASFWAQRQQLDERMNNLKDQIDVLDNQKSEQEFSLRKARQEYGDCQEEIQSLKQRRSNIDDKQIQIRAALCAALNLNEQDMPFVGELLQIQDHEKQWEGAAERLLRNFGLSLLVPDAYYARVSEWVEHNALRGRLVYFRIHQTRRGDVNLHPDSLVRKLAIKQNTPFYHWLEQELSHRFDVACCVNTTQFQRESRAMTLAGQLKDPQGRHEKDDRFHISDRSRYVLGWTNDAKIAELERVSKQFETNIAEAASQLATVKDELKRLNEQKESASSCLEAFTHFDELDWASSVASIAKLEHERQQLEASSDKLQQLSEQLAQLEREINATKNKLSDKAEESGAIQEKIKAATQLQGQTQSIVEQGLALLAVFDERLHVFYRDILGEHQLTVESCDNREQDLRSWFNTRIGNREQSAQTVRDRIITAMLAFKQEFKLETADFDNKIEAAFEYQKLLEQLNSDDLPRFETRFKELLNVNAINEIANFNAQLMRERETIRERIDRINESLTQIDYNPGRYIVLEAQPSTDIDIRDFINDLRACTDGALTGSEDNQYAETKFLQVRAIIERFRGREGSTEQDKRWTAKVTDVRHWFLFAASERWRHDDVEHEHYSDSGGKSGGQKEKLAYTILAASLAYQFRLQWNEVRSRSFRFVVIDEAFGRGSDESAQYGLNLFKQLNLQLLIVTPLQKIHIIEPYVANVGFVHNEGGQDSRLRNLSISEYQQHKTVST